MEKRQFFASFIVDPDDEAGHELRSFRIIESVLQSLVAKIEDPSIRSSTESWVHEVLLRAWMFDAVFNGDWKRPEDILHEDVPLWPLVAVYLFGEPFFLNRAYCDASGLSPAEIRAHVRTGHFYEEVYAGADAERARAGVQRLRAGKGYRDLGLSMKHIHRTTYWNSYGGGAEEMEIRIGRDIPDHDHLHDDYYQGDTMNSVSILENIYTHLAKHLALSPVERSKIFWIAEYLSLFDFLWNHGGFALECVFVSTSGDGREDVTGHYNPIYAGLLEQSFQGQESFRKIFPFVYGDRHEPGSVRSWFDALDELGWIPVRRHRHRRAIAEIFWRHVSCAEECLPDRPILWVGIARPLRQGHEGWWRRVWKKVRPEK